MTELAAQLVDRVIPDVPVRQWVLSLPWSLRYQLAFDECESSGGGVRVGLLGVGGVAAETYSRRDIAIKSTLERLERPTRARRHVSFPWHLKKTPRLWRLPRLHTGTEPRPPSGPRRPGAATWSLSEAKRESHEDSPGSDAQGQSDERHLLVDAEGQVPA